MINAIDEIIAYEKQAKIIVEDACVKADEILEKAKKKKEEIRLDYLAEKNKEVEKYHDDVEKNEKEHISHSMDMRNEAFSRIDDLFDKNSENWISEIFNTVIS